MTGGELTGRQFVRDICWRKLIFSCQLSQAIAYACTCGARRKRKRKTERERVRVHFFPFLPAGIDLDYFICLFCLHGSCQRVRQRFAAPCKMLSWLSNFLLLDSSLSFSLLHNSLILRDVAHKMRINSYWLAGIYEYMVKKGEKKSRRRKGE